MSSSWPCVVNSLLQLLHELLKWGQTPPASQPWSAAPRTSTKQLPRQGERFGVAAPMLTNCSQSCWIIKSMPASFAISSFYPIFVHPIWMLQPHLSVATPQMPPHPGAPAATGPCLVRVVGKAGTHPGLQLLCLDSIRALAAPAMIAPGLQWQLISRNCTPLLCKAATQSSFRDYTYLNEKKTLGFNKSS